MALHVREDVVRREATRLASEGIVVIEEVGGRTFVALSGVSRRAAKAKPADEDDPAFG